MDDPGFKMVLSGLDKKLDDLGKEVRAEMKQLDDKLDAMALAYVTKAEFNEDKKTRRTIVMWGVGLMVTIALATWTIIASRPDPVIIDTTESLLGWLF